MGRGLFGGDEVDGLERILKNVRAIYEWIEMGFQNKKSC